MLKIQNWDHHIFVWVCVSGYLSEIFGCIIIFCSNQESLTTWDCDLWSSWQGRIRKSDFGACSGQNLSFWPAPARIIASSGQLLFYWYNKGECGKENKQRIRAIHSHRGEGDGPSSVFYSFSHHMVRVFYNNIYCDISHLMREDDRFCSVSTTYRQLVWKVIMRSYLEETHPF